MYLKNIGHNCGNSRWNNYVDHSNGWDLGCNIGELGGEFKWPIQMGGILGAILVNWVGNFSGPPKWVQFVGAILVNWVW